MSRFAGRRSIPMPRFATDADVRAFIRRTADTIFHPAGTCRMGTGADAVVDPQLRVRGIDGLRVADASIFPDQPQQPDSRGVCGDRGEGGRLRRPE